MEYLADVQVLSEIAVDRDASPEQLDGAVGLVAVSNVGYQFCQPEGVWRLVF